jgi:predicted GNAT family N-acyltransferase
MSEQALLRWAEGEADLQGAFAVRQRVFCTEQGVPVEIEIDEYDDEALHLVALAPGGEIIGTLRLVFAGESVKVGRVAVDRSWRRRAIASRMLSMALAEAAGRGALRARLAAQVEAVELYRRAGFEICSDTFEEVGIPHVWMDRAL